MKRCQNWILASLCVGWTLGCGVGPDWKPIPDDAPFDMGRTETLVEHFVQFLNESGTVDYPETVQIACRAGTPKYAAKPGVRRQAVAEVTPAEAEAFCVWLSEKTGRRVRLPTPAEWEWAARGGVAGAPYPWGWGGVPAERAQFDSSGPAAFAGVFPANGYGLRDMAGNLYEWCAATPEDPADSRQACGGSWAERDPLRLQNDHRQAFPAATRGRDVGFRVAREP